jgi:hypothetical protein
MAITAFTSHQESGAPSMLDTCEMNGTPVASNSAVLMARIVDRTGRAITRSEVASIKYSIVEIDRTNSDQVTIVPGYDDMPLDVDQVIFDTPEFGGLWTIDEEGYNFRHEIAANLATGFPKPRAHYQVCYELESTTGERSIVRFQLRIN